MGHDIGQMTHGERTNVGGLSTCSTSQSGRERQLALTRDQWVVVHVQASLAGRFEGA